MRNKRDIPTNENTNRKTVAANVRRLRLYRGLSQAALAARSGVSRGTVCAVEAGRRNVGLRALRRIASALGAAMADLFRPVRGLRAVRFPLPGRPRAK